MLVVYIEDNANNQRLFKRMMNKRGIDVVIFDDPYTAHEDIHTLQPAMIFTDVHLKARHTGLHLVKWLREEGVSVPIIAVTCFNMLADRQRAIAAGCDGYLLKPYQMRDLFELLDQHLACT